MVAQIYPLISPFDRATYANLPSTTGVYVFRKDGAYLYIGKSVNIKSRVLTHVESSAVIEKEHAIISQANMLTVIVTDSEFKALLLESQLIQSCKPKYNVIWRDGKSHLYIKITAEEYPKIISVRKEDDQKSSYFGPFSSSKDVEDLLHIIRKIIPYCSQEKITSRACFYSKIDLCSPCPNKINSMTGGQEKSLLKKEYKSNIRKITDILKGKTDKLVDSMNRELKVAIKVENYEKGIELRNRLYTLEYLTKYRSFSRYSENDFNTSQSSLSKLERLLSSHFSLSDPLKRIECYDISNLSQKQATGSMVVLTDGLIDKGQYRKFKIKNMNLQSDFDMLEEVVRRRFHNSWIRPSLIVIDGGRPQIRRVIKALKTLDINIPVIGIAKHPDRIILGSEKFSTLKLPIHDLALRLIQMIRDESHRFARKYHLLLREKAML